MKLLYFLLLSVLLATLFYGLRFFQLLTKSKDLVRRSVPFQQSGDASLLPFIFCGDSTGMGVGTRNKEETFAGYFGRDFPGRPIQNISKSGRKTQELISVLQSHKTQSAEWIFIQIGGNDILYFTSQKNLADHIAQVIQEAKRIGKHTVLLTSGNVGSAPFFPKAISGIWAQKTRKVRELFKATAEAEGILYVDLFQERKNDLFLTNVPFYYSSDLLHPSGEGYKNWYMQTREVIRENNLESAL